MFCGGKNKNLINFIFNFNIILNIEEEFFKKLTQTIKRRKYLKQNGCNDPRVWEL